MSDIKELTEIIIKHRDKRNWKQFHNPKDLAAALSLESSEVLEHFLWQTKEEMDEHLKNHKTEVADELADALYWILLMSHDFDIDIYKAFKIKMKKNEKKYPVKKAKGKHTKYTDL